MSDAASPGRGEQELPRTRTDTRCAGSGAGSQSWVPDDIDLEIARFRGAVADAASDPQVEFSARVDLAERLLARLEDREGDATWADHEDAAEAAGNSGGLPTSAYDQALELISEVFDDPLLETKQRASLLGVMGHLYLGRAQTAEGTLDIDRGIAALTELDRLVPEDFPSVDHHRACQLSWPSLPVTRCCPIPLHGERSHTRV